MPGRQNDTRFYLLNFQQDVSSLSWNLEQRDLSWLLQGKHSPWSQPGSSAAECGPWEAAISTNLPEKRLGSSPRSPASFVLLTSSPWCLRVSRTASALYLSTRGRPHWLTEPATVSGGLAGSTSWWVPDSHSLLQSNRATQGCIMIPLT